MRPDEDDAGALADMVLYGERAQRSAHGRSFEDFCNDVDFRGVVERWLSVVGEAATRVSAEFRAAHPEVRWAQIIGLRNRLVHAYQDTDAEILWEITRQDIPELLRVLNELLKDAAEDL